MHVLLNIEKYVRFCLLDLYYEDGNTLVFDDRENNARLAECHVTKEKVDIVVGLSDDEMTLQMFFTQGLELIRASILESLNKFIPTRDVSINISHIWSCDPINKDVKYMEKEPFEDEHWCAVERRLSYFTRMN